MKPQKTGNNKVNQAKACSVITDYKEFNPIAPVKGKEGHYLVEFVDAAGKKERKELCIVSTGYKTLWAGNCLLTLPKMADASPKGEVYMLTKDKEGNAYNIAYVPPRWNTCNYQQLNRAGVSLAVNYYAWNNGNEKPAFLINDRQNMPLGKKVKAHVIVRQKTNEKGSQLILDCYVFPAVSDKEPVYSLIIDDKLPDEIPERAFAVRGENRKVIITRRK